MTIPDSFARTTLELHGAAGRVWLSRLPSIIADCAGRWSLSVLPPFEPLSYNYVAPAVRTAGADVGRASVDAVLKVGVPNHELLTEIEALRLYDGHGAARLLEADPDKGALLVERLKPGTPLSKLADDEQATSIAVQVMCQLWKPPPPEHSFPSVADWAAGLKRLRTRFGGGSGPLPAASVEAAEALFGDLIGSMAEPVLLHGDLHHQNILAADRQPWLAIDPKGLIGEPAYEVGALLRNPMPEILQEPQPGRILA
jgi:streptomycin 6-kinase